MKVTSGVPRFGWGGKLGLPTSETFLLDAQRGQGKKSDSASSDPSSDMSLAQTVFDRLNAPEDEAPRFVAVTNLPRQQPGKMDRAYQNLVETIKQPNLQNQILQGALRSVEQVRSSESSARSHQSPLGRLLHQVAVIFGIQKLQDLGEPQAHEKSAVKAVQFNALTTVRTIMSPTGGNYDVLGLRFDNLKALREMEGPVPELEIADIRQFCKDKDLKETDLYTIVPMMGGYQVKPQYATQIRSNYTMSIPLKELPGDTATFFLNPRSPLWYRITTALPSQPPENYAPYQYFSSNTAVMEPTHSTEADNIVKLPTA